MSGSQNELQKLKSYWKKHGRQELGLEKSTAKKRDQFLQTLIEESILQWLSPNTKVLDIGCGNGVSTLRFADKVGKVVGIDYAEEQIDLAKNNAYEQRVSNVEFQIGDTLDLTPTLSEHGLFDVVVSIRCLINLPNWDLQAQAIKEIAESLRPGGLYIASEGWLEGVKTINRFRQRMGLSRMEIVKNNKFISRNEFETETQKYFNIKNQENFGFYYFMSRLFQAAFVCPDDPVHDHEINRIAQTMLLSGIGKNAMSEFDYGGIYVLQTRES